MGLLVRAHLPIQTYHQKITRKWHQDYRMVINGSLKKYRQPLSFKYAGAPATDTLLSSRSHQWPAPSQHPSAPVSLFESTNYLRWGRPLSQWQTDSLTISKAILISRKLPMVIWSLLLWIRKSNLLLSNLENHLKLPCNWDLNHYLLSYNWKQALNIANPNHTNTLFSGYCY